MADSTPAKRTRHQTRHYAPLELGQQRDGEIVSAKKLKESPARRSTKWRAPVTPLTTPSRVSTHSAAQPAVVTPTSEAELAKTTATATSGGSSETCTNATFVDLELSAAELRPSATLTNGQCFHWKVLEQASPSLANVTTPTAVFSTEKIYSVKTGGVSAWGTHDATEWLGILRDSTSGNSVVVIIRETPKTTLFRVLKAPENLCVKSFLHAYFQLDHPLAPLCQSWSRQDRRLARIAQCIPGARVVDQDPWECLVSFLCSSNNNIPRITKMLSAIRREYGSPLLEYNGEMLYSFPSLKDLQKKATDADLRKKCGMGYRSKYLLETMKILDSLGGEAYLHELKQGCAQGTIDSDKIQEALIQFCGVGRKVADCVALFSLKQACAIPVDVHVWNIARRDYDEEGLFKDVKSLTPTIYKQVGDIFRNRFPDKAGWAHSLLFLAELPSFRPVLPSDMIEEMDKFRAKEQARKKAGK